MATIFRWDSLRILLALAAISVALPVALVGCGGGEESLPRAPTSPATPAEASAVVASPTSEPKTEMPTEERDRSLTVYSGRSQ